MNRKNGAREKLLPSLLIFVLMLVTCTAKISTDESSVITNTPTPEVTIEPASPIPTKGENSSEDVILSLVAAKVREIERYDESVTVEVEKETPGVSLPGLSFYAATPMVVDSLDDHCAVYGEEVWCAQEALQNIVRRFSLGTNPEQLSDEEWLALIAFFTYTTPLDNADDLGSNAQSIPEREWAKISEPVVDRHESGGKEISFYFIVEDIMGFGDVSLNVLEVLVTEDNTLLVEHREIWNNYDREE